MRLDVLAQTPKGDVVTVKRKSTLDLGALNCGVTAGDAPAHARDGGAAFIHVYMDADPAITFALTAALGQDFPQPLALHVRELQILEHDIHELL